MFGNDLKTRATSKKWSKDGYNYTHLDAKGDKRWELPLLAFKVTPLFSGRLALARGHWLLERISSRSLGARVAKIARWRVSGHRVSSLHKS
jgi:hypothetical protein